MFKSKCSPRPHLEQVNDGHVDVEEALGAAWLVGPARGVKVHVT